MSRALAAALAVAGLAACGVKAPPRPPAGATRAAAPATSTEPGPGADAAPGPDCGPPAATAERTER